MAYIERANWILLEIERCEAEELKIGLATAEKDCQFFEDYPVNGDIDLSPYSLNS